MRVWSLGWEDPMEEGMATHSSILAWRIPWTEEPVGYSPQGWKESDTWQKRLSTHAQGMKPKKEKDGGRRCCWKWQSHQEGEGAGAWSCVHKDRRKERRALGGNGRARKGHEDEGEKAGMSLDCIGREGQADLRVHLGKEEDCGWELYSVWFCGDQIGAGRLGAGSTICPARPSSDSHLLPSFPSHPYLRLVFCLGAHNSELRCTQMSAGWHRRLMSHTKCLRRALAWSQGTEVLVASVWVILGQGLSPVTWVSPASDSCSSGWLSFFSSWAEIRLGVPSLLLLKHCSKAKGSWRRDFCLVALPRNSQWKIWVRDNQDVPTDSITIPALTCHIETRIDLKLSYFLCVGITLLA